MKWLTNMGKDQWTNMSTAYMMAHVCGKPQATEEHSVEELERMRLVGIYEAR